MKMNKDLKEERDRIPFDIEELTNWYYGGADKVKRRRFFGNNWIFIFLNSDLDQCTKFYIISEKYFYEDPQFKDEVDVSYLSHVEKYENAIKKLTIILKKLRELTDQGQYGKEIYP